MPCKRSWLTSLWFLLVSGAPGILTVNVESIYSASRCGEAFVDNIPLKSNHRPTEAPILFNFACAFFCDNETFALGSAFSFCPALFSYSERSRDVRRFQLLCKCLEIFFILCSTRIFSRMPTWDQKKTADKKRIVQKMGFLVRSLFEKWSLPYLSNRFKMAVALCNKNVLNHSEILFRPKCVKWQWFEIRACWLPTSQRTHGRSWTEIHQPCFVSLHWHRLNWKKFFGITFM